MMEQDLVEGRVVTAAAAALASAATKAKVKPAPPNRPIARLQCAETVVIGWLSMVSDIYLFSVVISAKTGPDLEIL